MSLIIIADWWGELNSLNKFFWGISIISTVFFIILFIIGLLGFDADSDAEIGDVGGGFPIFSAKALVAFFTFFGWTGVLLLNQDKDLFPLFGFSFLSGLSAMLLVSYLLKIFNQMTEVGNADPMELTFQRGNVYLTVPADRNGKGKIHIILGGTLREISAITDGPSLPFGCEVRVIEVIENDLLLVEAAEPI